jgi:hypothetical protein
MLMHRFWPMSGFRLSATPQSGCNCAPQTDELHVCMQWPCISKGFGIARLTYANAAAATSHGQSASRFHRTIGTTSTSGLRDVGPRRPGRTTPRWMPSECRCAAALPSMSPVEFIFSTLLKKSKIIHWRNVP